MLKNSKLLTLSLFFVFGNCFAVDNSGEGRPSSPRELRPNSFAPVSPALFAELSRGSVSPLPTISPDSVPQVSSGVFIWADDSTPDDTIRKPTEFDIAVQVARIKADMKKLK